MTDTTERQAIVTWLRRQSELAGEKANIAGDRDYATYLYNSDEALSKAADAIESGVHLKDPQ